ncbi:MAG: hypothetical protein K6G04_05900 [Lachnospiraceae bacterium]|nr:hypothetical protein [Lachnospiraceae bacterium]
MALPSGKKVNAELHTSLLTTSKELNCASWKQVYSACFGRIVGSQATYRKVICGGKPITPSYADGKVFFDDKHFPAQILGVVSNKVWTWGFAHPIEAPDACFQLATEIQDFGRKFNLQPLKESVQPLGKGFLAEHLAVTGVGISKNFYCYCKIEEKDYDLYVAFSKLPSAVFNPVKADTFFKLAARSFPMFNVEHRTFVESLLLWNGVSYEWKLKKLLAHFDEDIELSFEDDDGIPRVFAMKII